MVWILSIDGAAGLKGWQWLFILEGLPACVMGVVTLTLLRNTPKQANWLSQAERDVLDETLALEFSGKPQRSLLAVIRDVRVIIMTCILFSYWIGINGIAIWLPLMLKNHQISIIQVGWLSALPDLVASVAMIFWARLMDRSGKYLLNLMATCIVASLGLALSVSDDALLPAMMGMTFAVIGLSSVRPAFYSLPSRYLAGLAVAGGLAFINSIGGLGDYISPWMVGALMDATGSFGPSTLAMSAMLLIAALLTLLLRRVVREELGADLIRTVIVALPAATDTEGNLCQTR